MELCLYLTTVSLHFPPSLQDHPNIVVDDMHDVFEERNEEPAEGAEVGDGRLVCLDLCECVGVVFADGLRAVLRERITLQHTRGLQVTRPQNALSKIK